MLNADGLVSLKAFLAGCSVLFFVSLTIFNITSEFVTTNIYYVVVLYSIIGACGIFWHGRGKSFQVAIRAYVLGAAFAFGLTVSLLAKPSWVVFGWYLCLLTFFHYSEYFTTSIINPTFLSLDSFLINHSTEYNLAALCSCIEFMIERWYYPDMKMSWLSYIGLGLCLAGEVLRKLAMFTAKSNFNHIIQVKKKAGHVLVTNGIYGLCRHPSYVGWFWWSIGTQVVLCNPLCFIGYCLASWKFFKVRIWEEEIILLNFFGRDYFEYQKKVSTGLPFIKGYDPGVWLPNMSS